MQFLNGQPFSDVRRFPLSLACLYCRQFRPGRRRFQDLIPFLVGHGRFQLICIRMHSFTRSVPQADIPGILIEKIIQVSQSSPMIAAASTVSRVKHHPGTDWSHFNVAAAHDQVGILTHNRVLEAPFPQCSRLVMGMGLLPAWQPDSSPFRSAGFPWLLGSEPVWTTRPHPLALPTEDCSRQA